MVSIMPMKLEDSHKIREIDRSETIHLIYTCKDGFGRPASSGEGKRGEIPVHLVDGNGVGGEVLSKLRFTITSDIDEELFEKEPHDIHMRLTL